MEHDGRVGSNGGEGSDGGDGGDGGDHEGRWEQRAALVVDGAGAVFAEHGGLYGEHGGGSTRERLRLFKEREFALDRLDLQGYVSHISRTTYSSISLCLC